MVAAGEARERARGVLASAAREGAGVWSALARLRDVARERERESGDARSAPEPGESPNGRHE
jgi:hypothetical protein